MYHIRMHLDAEDRRLSSNTAPSLFELPGAVGCTLPHRSGHMAEAQAREELINAERDRDLQCVTGRRDNLLPSIYEFALYPA